MDIPSHWEFTGFPPWIRLWPDPSPLPPRPQGGAARGTAGFAGVGPEANRIRAPGPAQVQLWGDPGSPGRSNFRGHPGPE